MQTKEVRFRVIKDDKPVGIIRLVPGKGAFHRDISDDECDFAPADIHFILGACCDRLELGVKVGDEWWFEGDKIQLNRSGGSKFVKFVFTGYKWEFQEPSKHPIGEGIYSYDIQKELSYAEKAIRIGSIHEENSDENKDT